VADSVRHRAIHAGHQGVTAPFSFGLIWQRKQNERADSDLLCEHLGLDPLRNLFVHNFPHADLDNRMVAELPARSNPGRQGGVA